MSRGLPTPALQLFWDRTGEYARRLDRLARTCWQSARQPSTIYEKKRSKIVCPSTRPDFSNCHSAVGIASFSVLHVLVFIAHTYTHARAHAYLPMASHDPQSPCLPCIAVVGYLFRFRGALKLQVYMAFFSTATLYENHFPAETGIPKARDLYLHMYQILESLVKQSDGWISMSVVVGLVMHFEALLLRHSEASVGEGAKRESNAKGKEEGKRGKGVKKSTMFHISSVKRSWETERPQQANIDV